jgi:hypothetical protein
MAHDITAPAATKVVASNIDQVPKSRSKRALFPALSRWPLTITAGRLSRRAKWRCAYSSSSCSFRLMLKHQCRGRDQGLHADDVYFSTVTTILVPSDCTLILPGLMFLLLAVNHHPVGDLLPLSTL